MADKPSLDYLMSLMPFERRALLKQHKISPRYYGQTLRSMGISPRDLGLNPRAISSRDLGRGYKLTQVNTGQLTALLRSA